MIIYIHSCHRKQYTKNKSEKHANSDLTARVLHTHTQNRKQCPINHSFMMMKTRPRLTIIIPIIVSVIIIIELKFGTERRMGEERERSRVVQFLRSMNILINVTDSWASVWNASCLRTGIDWIFKVWARARVKGTGSRRTGEMELLSWSTSNFADSKDFELLSVSWF